VEITGIHDSFAFSASDHPDGPVAEHVRADGTRCWVRLTAGSRAEFDLDEEFRRMKEATPWAQWDEPAR
jgi:hypothetical protein